VLLVGVRLVVVVVVGVVVVIIILLCKKRRFCVEVFVCVCACVRAYVTYVYQKKQKFVEEKLFSILSIFIF